MKKKLSKAARKKDLTGVNLEADKKREARLEKQIAELKQAVRIIALELGVVKEQLRKKIMAYFLNKSQPKRSKGK